jgi:soluble lytic murein transglycosylase-like protein
MTASVQTYADWKTPEIREIVQTESRKHRIPERIIYNLIFAESSGRPYIKGNPIRINLNGKRIVTRAHGLMQIIPEYHYKGNKEDLLRPEINIPIGCKLLHRYLKRSKGNMVKALRLYNGQVRNKDDEYIRKILKK